MGASRKPRPDDAVQAGVEDDGVQVLQTAIDAALSGISSVAVGLAVSGGPDSFALAVMASRLAPEHGKTLRIFHVHHGLQKEADGWADEVQSLADALELPCHVARVQVADKHGAGVEAAAREARYGALAELARQHGVEHIL